MTADKPGLALEDDQNPSCDVVGIRQLTSQLEPEHTASGFQPGDGSVRDTAEGWMLQQRERRDLGHREMLKSMKPLVATGSVVWEASWLKQVAVSSSSQASNISWHI